MKKETIKKKFDIRERTFDFSLDVIRLARLIPKNDIAAQVVYKQLVRSATSIGANMEEADSTISTPDFIHKVNIAKKEAQETKYWLRLSKEFVSSQKVQLLIAECMEIIKILAKMIRNSQKKNQSK
ncbi:four helix bundle protein [Candidatus Margulisiibacteriota bacterium]